LYSFGPFQLDTAEQILLRDGQPLPLKPKVFDLLVVLVENSGHVVCKDELMKQVWADSFVEEGNLAVSICEIRKTLGGSANGHTYIATVPRRGCRFVAYVIEASQHSDGLAVAPSSVTGAVGAYGGGRRGRVALAPSYAA